MSKIAFDQWFGKITEHVAPRQWQSELAAESICRNRLIRIPTGLGKTEGVLAAWSFHRLSTTNDKWPRRLVWCLPMRVLVEQTEHVATVLKSRMTREYQPEIHIAMGGEDNSDWFLHPERPAIIIGTQDMLLSRALNRGYASGRARWPVEFGLLNQDALWIMDEVQLMDVGLATSAQLQAYRDGDRGKTPRPCYTWWMSATLQPDWLKSVDTYQHHAAWIQKPAAVAPAQRTGGMWNIQKTLITDAVNRDDTQAFALRILAEHATTRPNEYGRITLVVCNTVDRACKTFDELRAQGRVDGVELVHSRFRPYERESWRGQFLSRASCSWDADRIIIATQVVEAGVDISAECLVTELAPWPSLVQRFGRCARYGGAGRVIVIDRGRDDSAAAPYLSEELESAWESIQTLSDVGILALESFEASLSHNARTRLYPYSPSHLLLKREFDELFDTTADLTGADLDISRFIRSGDERDLQVFWIDLEKPKSPPHDRRPQRRELCAVPFLKARAWLCGEETKTNRKPRLRSGIRAWLWDWIEGEWVDVIRAGLIPGRVVCVASECGGYRTERGFDPISRTPVPPIPPPPIPAGIKAADEADSRQDGEDLSQTEWKTIACHSSEVASAAREIAAELRLPGELQEALVLAARWHDWGKSHPAFQGALRDVDRPDRIDLAKGPKGAWRRPPDMYKFLDGSETRPGFRHELASALALFAILRIFSPQHPALLGPWPEVHAKLGKSPPVGGPLPAPSSFIQRLLDCSAEQFDLLIYLVASHHGKVRVALHAGPKDQEYRDNDGRGLPIRGIREGDQLPSIAIVPGEPNLPAVTLTLAPAALGLSEITGISWRERSIGLMERYGPAGLAFLEAILRAADIRASRLTTGDPTLATEAGK